MTLESTDPGPERQLSSRERQVETELRRLDPHLAGLFYQGLALADAAEAPGNIYMLSHAGRELSNGVIRLLAGEGDPIPTESCEDRPSDERHRDTIAPALGLRPMDPVVTTWLRTHRTLQKTAHYRSSTPPPETVREAVEAFHALTGLLFGRIGLYFEAREEVDVLLQVEEPTREHVDRMQALITRPQLRTVFFRQLRHLGWLEPLHATGLFREVPGLGVDPESGARTALPWPAGQYLVSIASEAANEVASVLLEVPADNTNPVVWTTVAEATRALPPGLPQIRELTQRLHNALETAGHPMLSRAVFDLAKYLAERGDGHALELLEGLLTPGSDEESRGLGLSSTGKTAILPRLSRWTDPDEVLDLVADVAALRAKATVARLCCQLDGMLTIEFGDPSDQEPPVWDYSCFRREPLGNVDDLEPMTLLTAAVLRAAVVAGGTEEAGLEWVIDRLSRFRWHVFVRLRLGVLAALPEVSRELLDAAIGDLSLFNTQPVAYELRHLVRAHFGDASSETQTAVIDHVLEGPNEDIVRGAVDRLIADGKSEEEAFELVRQRWQRHLLRLFGEETPEPLEPLAVDLGVKGEVLSRVDRDLDELGHAVGGVYAASGPRSPLGLEELQALDLEQLHDYLREFEPEAGIHAPTRAGLAMALRELVEDDPEAAASLIESLPDAELDPTYARGVLEGLVAAVKEGRAVPWRESLVLVEWVCSRPPDPEMGRSPAYYLDATDPGFAWARTAAARLLVEVTRTDQLPQEFADALWGAVGTLVEAEATWAGPPAAAESMESVLQIELNALGGRAAHALFSTALYAYRAWKEDHEEDDWPGRMRLRPLLDGILRRTGSAAVAARSAIGRYLAKLVLLDKPWIEESRNLLFDNAIEEPFENPVFASYLVNAGLWQQPFELFRELYQAAVKQTEVPGNAWTSEDGDFRPARRLLDHLFGAYLAGWLVLPDDAELLERAFAAGRREDVEHVFWKVFRIWTDAEAPPDPDRVERLIAIWDWRLGRLEAEEEGQNRRLGTAALAWLALAEAVPDEAVLPLLLRTVRTSEGEVPVAGSFWPVLARLAPRDSTSTTEIADRIVRRELGGRYPHFNFAELAPVLGAGLRSEDAGTRELAQRLVHDLGGNGFEEFGALLREADG